MFYILNSDQVLCNSFFFILGKHQMWYIILSAEHYDAVCQQSLQWNNNNNKNTVTCLGMGRREESWKL